MINLVGDIEDIALSAKRHHSRRSSIVIIHPVGLPGETMKMALVVSSHAAKRASRSSRQRSPSGSQRHLADDAALDLDRREDIRPDRRDDDNLITRIQHRLHQHQNAGHCRAGNGDALDRRLDPVEAPVIALEARPQFRNAALMRIECVTLAQRLAGGI